MIELQIENATDFKKCIDAIAVLIDEAEFILSDDALTLKATDPSQISMIDFHMPKKAFKSYKIKSDTKIALDVKYLKDVMGRSKAKDKMTIALEDKSNNLQLTFEGTSKRSFSVPLIDISSNELPTPKIDFDAELKMKSEILQDALKDAALISTHITLGVDGNNFFVRAKSTKGTLNSETPKTQKEMLSMNAKKECSAMFPLSYLSDMLKGAPSDSEISLYLKANAPLKLGYAISEANFSYFLAPRIESE